MNSPPPHPKSRLNRAQVHTVLGKLKLPPAASSLAQSLLTMIDDQGGAQVPRVHGELFPLASTKSANAHVSKLLKAIESASEGRIGSGHEGSAPQCLSSRVAVAMSGLIGVVRARRIQRGCAVG